MRFKIDWASLIVGSKFTVFALFYFVFEGNLPSRSPGGGLYLEGRFNGGFYALPVWGAYIWRGLFSEFYCLPGKTALTKQCQMEIYLPQGWCKQKLTDLVQIKLH